MRFQPPLTPATLIRRYKRFLADVTLPDGRETTAHVPNSGAMLGVSDPGARVWLSPARPGRKLDWTLHLVETGDGLAGVDTHLPNRLVEEALKENRIAPLAGYAEIRREVVYGQRSRIDFLLTAPDRPPCFLEVKNVHLKRTPGLAEFPDCLAARSAKHMRELAAEVTAGARAAVVFVVQRQGCCAFAPAADLDPGFATALAAAQAAGVEAYAYQCRLSPEEIVLESPLEVRIPGVHSVA